MVATPRWYSEYGDEEPCADIVLVGDEESDWSEDPGQCQLDPNEVWRLRIGGTTTVELAERYRCSVAEVVEALEAHARERLAESPEVERLGILDRIDQVYRAAVGMAGMGEGTSALNTAINAVKLRIAVVGLEAPKQLDVRTTDSVDLEVQKLIDDLNRQASR